MGTAERAFLGRGLSPNPQPSSSADHRLDNQLIVESVHPPTHIPGPLPPSLCWSCHDNQSSPSVPKTLQRTTKAPPSAKREEGNGRYMAHASSTAPKRSAELGTWRLPPPKAEPARRDPSGGLFHLPLLSVYSRLMSVPAVSSQFPSSLSPFWGRGQRAEGRGGWSGAQRPVVTLRCRLRRSPGSLSLPGPGCVTWDKSISLSGALHPQPLFPTHSAGMLKSSSGKSQNPIHTELSVTDKALNSWGVSLSAGFTLRHKKKKWEGQF